MGPASYRTFVEQVLLASLWNLLLYCVTAVFLLPWSQGAAHGRSPTPDDWQEAHFTHECWLLVLSGVGGALTLLVQGRRAAALSWLTGCVVVIAGFRGQRTYHERVEEQAQAAVSSRVIQSKWPTSEGRYSQLLENKQLNKVHHTEPTPPTPLSNQKVTFWRVKKWVLKVFGG